MQPASRAADLVPEAEIPGLIRRPTALFSRFGWSVLLLFVIPAALPAQSIQTITPRIQPKSALRCYRQLKKQEGNLQPQGQSSSSRQVNFRNILKF
jgi:hypothetical protein